MKTKMKPLKFSNKDNLMILYVSPSFFPDGRTRVPEVLTPKEAIKFLRLDTDGSKNPHATLKYYRDTGKLKGIKVGRKLRYTKTALLEFLDELSKDKTA